MHSEDARFSSGSRYGRVCKGRDQCYWRLLCIWKRAGEWRFGFDFDITKLSVHTLDIGLAGIEVYDILRDEYDIQIEFGDIGNILAYLSIGDRVQEIERLVSALAEIRRRFQKDKSGLLDQEYIDPQVVTSPQEAFMQKMQPSSQRNRRQSMQRVCNVLSSGNPDFGSGGTNHSGNPGLY